MLFSVALSTVTLFACASQREVKLDLYQDSACIGHGFYREVWTGDKRNGPGNRKSTFDITGSDGEGGTLHIIQTKTIDSDGYPVEEEETMIDKKGRSTTTTLSKVHYDETGAAILDVYHGKSKATTRSYVPLPGLSRADESDLWFSSPRHQPRQGTTVKSTVFDIEKAKWQKIETTYVAKKWIIVNGESIQANEVRDVRDGVSREVYLDDKGMPVLMTNGPYSTKKHTGD